MVTVLRKTNVEIIVGKDVLEVSGVVGMHENPCRKNIDRGGIKRIDDGMEVFEVIFEFAIEVVGIDGFWEMSLDRARIQKQIEIHNSWE